MTSKTYSIDDAHKNPTEAGDEPTRFQLRFMCAVMDDLATAILAGNPPSCGAEEAARAMLDACRRVPQFWTAWEMEGLLILSSLLGEPHAKERKHDAALTAGHWIEATERGLR